MLIEGLWLRCDDGVLRPVIPGEAQAADGSWVELPFLVDVGADRTVLTEAFLSILGWPSTPSHDSLGGVGGISEAVLIPTTLRLAHDMGEKVVFRGQFHAFTDPAALDMSGLGRDILNFFAVIVDHPGVRVCLLGQRHRYRIERQ